MADSAAADALTFHVHWDAYLSIGLLVVGWVRSVRRTGRLLHPRPEDPPVRPGQVTALVAAVAVLWISAASPLHDVGERYLFSAHMVQHLLDAFVLPPLLLLATPPWMFELLLRGPLRRLVRTLARPLVATALFNGVLVAMHVPAVVELMSTNDPFHLCIHLLLTASALVMWLPVLSPDSRVVPRLSEPLQMGYLFLQTILPTIPASFLTFTDTAFYPVYAEAPRVWGLSAVDDLRIAGLIMKIGGGLWLWGFIATIFFRWAAREERAERSRTVETRSVEP